MKLLFVITLGAGHPAHKIAAALISEASRSGDEVLAVYFTKDACAICSSDPGPSSGLYTSCRPGRMPLLVCSRALHEHHINEVHASFTVTGNTELIKLIEQCDRVVQF